MEDLNFVDKIKSILREVITDEEYLDKYKDVLKIQIDDIGIGYTKVEFTNRPYSQVSIITTTKDVRHDGKSSFRSVRDKNKHFKYIYNNLDGILEPFKSRIPFLYDLGKSIKMFNLEICNGQVMGTLFNYTLDDIDNGDFIKKTIRFSATSRGVDLTTTYSDFVDRYDLDVDNSGTVEVNGETLNADCWTDRNGNRFHTLSKTIRCTLPKLPAYSKLMDTGKIDKLFKAFNKKIDGKVS